jgi:hypothetical protein
MVSRSVSAYVVRNAWGSTKVTIANHSDKHYVNVESYRTPSIVRIMLRFPKGDRRKISARNVTVGNVGRSKETSLGLTTAIAWIVFLKKVKKLIALLCESISSDTTCAFCFSTFQSFDKTSLELKRLFGLRKQKGSRFDLLPFCFRSDLAKLALSSSPERSELSAKWYLCQSASMSACACCDHR